MFKQVLFWLETMLIIKSESDFYRDEKNSEEIQDLIANCTKREIKVQKRNKSLKKEIKVLKRNRK